MAAALAIRIVVRIMILDVKSLTLLNKLVVYRANFDYRSNNTRTTDEPQGR